MLCGVAVTRLAAKAAADDAFSRLLPYRDMDETYCRYPYV
jgi:hypothetical protein